MTLHSPTGAGPRSGRVGSSARAAAALLSAVLVVLAAPGTASAQTVVDGWSVTYQGRSHDAASDTTTFSWLVAATGQGQDLSHFTVECADFASVTATSPTNAVQPGLDPTTGVTGIKWDFGLTNTPGVQQVYSLTLPGDVPTNAGGVVAVKAGRNPELAALGGPGAASGGGSTGGTTTGGGGSATAGGGTTGGSTTGGTTTGGTTGGSTGGGTTTGGSTTGGTGSSTTGGGTTGGATGGGTTGGSTGGGTTTGGSTGGTTGGGTTTGGNSTTGGGSTGGGSTGGGTTTGGSTGGGTTTGGGSATAGGGTTTGGNSTTGGGTTTGGNSTTGGGSTGGGTATGGPTGGGTTTGGSTGGTTTGGGTGGTTGGSTGGACLALDGFEVCYDGRVYDATTHTTSFSYTVTATGTGQDLSHFTVEAACHADDVSTTPSRAVSLGLDPTTGVEGVKWDIPLANTPGSSASYVITLMGDVAEDPAGDVAVKAGQVPELGTLPGPGDCMACSCGGGTTPPTTASISGTVYVDMNENMVRDAGEPAIANVTVELVDAAGATVTTLTETDGSWSFDQVPAGTWTVSVPSATPGNATDFNEQLEDSLDPTTPGSLTVDLQGSDSTDNDFGFRFDLFAIHDDFSRWDPDCDGVTFCGNNKSRVWWKVTMHDAWSCPPGHGWGWSSSSTTQNANLLALLTTVEGLWLADPFSFGSTDRLRCAYDQLKQRRTTWRRAVKRQLLALELNEASGRGLAGDGPAQLQTLFAEATEFFVANITQFTTTDAHNMEVILRCFNEVQRCGWGCPHNPGAWSQGGRGGSHSHSHGQHSGPATCHHGHASPGGQGGQGSGATGAGSGGSASSRRRRRRVHWAQQAAAALANIAGGGHSGQNGQGGQGQGSGQSGSASGSGSGSGSGSSGGAGSTSGAGSSGSSGSTSGGSWWSQFMTWLTGQSHSGGSSGHSGSQAASSGSSGSQGSSSGSSGGSWSWGWGWSSTSGSSSGSSGSGSSGHWSWSWSTGWCWNP